MQELVLDTDTLPKALMERLRSPKVKVVELNDVLALVPIAYSIEHAKKHSEIAKLEGKIDMADNFIKYKQEEKLLEEEREKRFHAPRLSKEEIDAIKKKFAGSPFIELFGSFAKD